MPGETNTTVASPGVSTPPWLDAALIQQALDNSGENDVKVTGLAVEAASAPGDNYGGALYRAKAQLSDGTERPLIVKTLPQDEMMAAAMLETGIFARETAVLARVVPKMEALLEEVAPGKFPALGPHCLLSSEGPNPFMIMEDLRPLEFKMADRCRGLGLRHCLLVLRSLARFHAASVALLRKEPNLADDFGNPWEPDNVVIKPIIETGIQSAADVFKEWPGFEEYARILEAYKPVAVETYCKLGDAKPGAFNVLVHGDFWVNNMMFRYENGKPREAKLIDFQLTHLASPAIDLLYFLSFSVSEDVSEHHEDLIIREYHTALTEAMSLLGLQAPTLEALQADMAAHGPTILFGATCGLPGSRAAGALDLAATMQGDGDKNAFIYRNPVVKKWYQRVFPEYKRRGWLPEV